MLKDIQTIGMISNVRTNLLAFKRAHRNWFRLVVVVIILTLVYGGWRLFGRSRGGFNQSQNERQAKIGQVHQQIDQVLNYAGRYTIADTTNLTNPVSKMPQFRLVAPQAEWFSDERLLAIGVRLGFNDQAIFTDLGTKKIWDQASKSLTIDTQKGTIQFNDAFNFGAGEPPAGIPTKETVTEVLRDFFDKTKLPRNYLNLDGLEYEYFTVDQGGVMNLVPAEQGSLLRADIPYVISGVPIILPPESAIVVGPAGKVYELSLFIPNVEQDDQMFGLISWERAKENLEQVGGAVIEIDQFDRTELTLDQVQVAYYLNREKYLSLSERRILVPVYIFSGDQGRVAVLATR